MVNETIGCLAALGSAAAWAYASILFRELGSDVSPAGMTLSSSAIGILYMCLALLAVGLEPVSSRAFFVLGVSGVLGLALGTVLFFRALIYLGPKLMMILGLICPVLTVGLAVGLLKERPSAAAWAGSFITLAGLAVVLWKRPDSEPREKLVPGVLCALLAALCTAFSIILAKVGVEGIPALEASLIRHIWAAAALLAWGLAGGGLKSWLAPFHEKRLAKLVFFATFVVIFGGFWLSMVALKNVYASAATVLNMTEPLFILPLTALLLKEKVSAREITGALVAFSGVALIFLR
ncbi:MAG: DMT family transporter [Elusimicrobia bacterium]|nr:DMT family transporter [Elusimicrobiota bacterium]